jgi:hypothetical protein
MESPSGHSGFKIPEGYFRDFPERMERRLGAVEEGTPATNQGFRVPEGYFDSFSDRLRDRMEQTDPPVRWLWVRKQVWIPAAAAAILLALLWAPSSRKTKLEFGDIKGEVLEAYLQTEEFDLTPGELAENIPLGEIAMEDVLDNAPGAQQLADYLEASIESNEELYWEPNE